MTMVGTGNIRTLKMKESIFLIMEREEYYDWWLGAMDCGTIRARSYHYRCRTAARESACWARKRSRSPTVASTVVTRRKSTAREGSWACGEEIWLHYSSRRGIGTGCL